MCNSVLSRESDQLTRKSPGNSNRETRNFYWTKKGEEGTHKMGPNHLIYGNRGGHRLDNNQPTKQGSGQKTTKQEKNWRRKNAQAWGKFPCGLKLDCIPTDFPPLFSPRCLRQRFSKSDYWPLQLVVVL